MRGSGNRPTHFGIASVRCAPLKESCPDEDAIVPNQIQVARGNSLRSGGPVNWSNWSDHVEARLLPGRGRLRLSGTNAASPCSSDRTCLRCRRTPIDTKHPAIRETLRGIARKHGAPARRSAALTTAEVKRLSRACRTDLAGAHDRALFLVGFAGALQTRC